LGIPRPRVLSLRQRISIRVIFCSETYVLVFAETFLFLFSVTASWYARFRRAISSSFSSPGASGPSREGEPVKVAPLLLREGPGSWRAGVLLHSLLWKGVDIII
jgi:hypothetical protein